jgi:hypothetical protein
MKYTSVHELSQIHPARGRVPSGLSTGFRVHQVDSFETIHCHFHARHNATHGGILGIAATALDTVFRLHHAKFCWTCIRLYVRGLSRRRLLFWLWSDHYKRPLVLEGGCSPRCRPYRLDRAAVLAHKDTGECFWPDSVMPASDRARLFRSASFSPSTGSRVLPMHQGDGASSPSDGELKQNTS